MDLRYEMKKGIFLSALGTALLLYDMNTNLKVYDSEEPYLPLKYALDTKLEYTPQNQAIIRSIDELESISGNNARNNFDSHMLKDGIILGWGLITLKRAANKRREEYEKEKSEG
jgi:hypothetical protein